MQSLGIVRHHGSCELRVRRIELRTKKLNNYDQVRLDVVVRVIKTHFDEIMLAVGPRWPRRLEIASHVGPQSS